MTQSERVAGWVVDGPVFRPLISRLSGPQRQLVRYRTASAFVLCRAIPIIALMFLAVPVVATSPLVCNCPNRGEAAWESLVFFGPIGFVIALMVAVIGAVASLSIFQRAYWGFYGTRPVSRRFLFWVQYFTGGVGALASIAASLALALLLLLAVYGWKPAVEAYAAAGSVSVPKLVLSLLTTTLLAYSFFVFMGWWHPYISLLSFFAIALGTAHELGHGSGPLFLYLLQRNGDHPPPYAEALIPIAISLVLAVLAERLLARRET